MKGSQGLATAAVAALVGLVAGGAALGVAPSRPLVAHALGCPAGAVAEPDPIARAGAAPVCRPPGLDTPAEMMTAQTADAARTLAPYIGWRDGAMRAAVAQKSALAGQQASVANATGAWRSLGVPPLHNDSTNPAYNQGPPGIGNQNQLGWPQLSGRVTSVAFDPARAGRWFLSSGGGGVWETTDAGSTWYSIGERLPVQIIGGIAFSPAAGGTVIAGSGDSATGTFGQPGLGVFRTTDDGATWQTAAGVPDGILTYRIAVDPTNPSIVYAATSKGLWRSTDDAQSFVNVMLPTTCTDYTQPKCFFANFVSDVVVRPANSDGSGGGKVLAAVGWRLGQALDVDGSTKQAPQNGIYESDTGAPGSFAFIDPGGSSTSPSTNGFATTPNVGRVSLGIAHGAQQDHDVVYALVSNAVLMQNCLEAGELDTPVCSTDVPTATATFIDGAYASRDFGKTWTQIMSPEALKSATTGSALVGIPGYSPGIQSWYNTYIDPDPTVQDATGNPTRVVVGLEEAWENDQLGAATTTVGNTTWHTISRYWNACLGIFNGLICAVPQTGASPSPPSATPGTTEHPDHHAEAFIPDPGGAGVTLIEGNDGGIWSQHVATGQDFSNSNWGNGINNGLQTVETYGASISKDGTIIAGLQDNGLMRIDGQSGREDMIFGGDAFLSYVDPGNSQNMIEEYVNGIADYTVDGGAHWCYVDPALSHPFGEVPMVMDRTDANHVLTAGEDVRETLNAFQGPTGQCDPTDTQNTQTNYWNGTVQQAPSPAPTQAGPPATFDLGTTPPTPANQSPTDMTYYAPHRATAADVVGENAYIGYCYNCTPLCPKCNPLSGAPFGNGIATNVGGDAQPAKGSSAGWHTITDATTGLSAARGLPNRFITSIRMDPANPRTVYVTLGGYGYRWLPPGATLDDISKVGSGHVFKSVDAGQSFTDITGDLPDVTANDTMLYRGQLLVATELGVFISSDNAGGSYVQLGSGLPNVRVRSLTADPANPNRIIVGTGSRGVWGFTFAAAAVPTPSPTRAATPQPASPHPSASPAPLPNTGRPGTTAELAWMLLLGLITLLAGVLVSKSRQRA